MAAGRETFDWRGCVGRLFPRFASPGASINSDAVPAMPFHAHLLSNQVSTHALSAGGQLPIPLYLLLGCAGAGPGLDAVEVNCHGPDERAHALGAV